MKVKHWSGYGCVEAKTVRRGGGQVAIEVWGNHERGLEPRYFDNRDWQRWLGKRFRVEVIHDVKCRVWYDRNDVEHMAVVITV